MPPEVVPHVEVLRPSGGLRRSVGKAKRERYRRSQEPFKLRLFGPHGSLIGSVVEAQNLSWRKFTNSAAERGDPVWDTARKHRTVRERQPVLSAFPFGGIPPNLELHEFPDRVP